MSPGYLAAPEAEEEATQKEFCDKEIGKTKVIKCKIEWAMFKDICAFTKVWVQVMTTGKSRDPRVKLIAMKLKARGVSFENMIKMTNDMATLLGKEQVDDDAKKEYRTSKLDKAEDEIKELEHAVDGLEKAEKKVYYSPASVTIQGVLKDMYDTFSMNLEKATETESTQQKNFENIISVQNKEMFTLQTTKSKKGIEKALEILTSDDAKARFNTSIKPGKKIFFLQTASEHPSLKPEVRGRVYGILKKAAATVRASGHLDTVVEAVEKDDYVKYKDYYINELNSDEVDT